MSAQILRETLRNKLDLQIRLETDALAEHAGDFGDLRRAQGRINGLDEARRLLQLAYTEIQ